MLKKHRLIDIGKPSFVELGPIVDISMGGLAIQYVENKNRTVESDELAIALPSDGIKVEPIPFRIISDVEVATMPGGKTIRNRCVEFGKLSDYQSYQLKTFIQNHTVHTQGDRRSGADRRQFSDPRFEEEEYREMYERRISYDRRNG